MIFNSLTFLVFFAIVMALHYAPFFSWHQKKINLMIASYLFYAAWNPPFVILLWGSTVVDWWAAQWMVRAKRERTRKAWMLISVCVNLGMLGYFKYGGFLVQNFVTIAASLGIIYHPPGWDIVLPVGISLHLRDLILHARRVPQALCAGRKLPQLRFVRDLLPAPGCGANHAPDRARPAVR